MPPESSSGILGAQAPSPTYYSPVPSTAKKYLTDAEWQYWYEGKPAPAVINDPYGVPMEQPGAKRDGGSFLDRVTNISCWNTLMDESAYMNKRWNDFKVA
jgi:putative spermidine/putrescine transport system substrate-binding protein